MNDNKIKKIVIAGGGTAGWMTAAAFSKVLGCTNYAIHLVESEEIGTIGVGEATIPHIQKFNQILDIDENEFMKKTQATFKLGIEFINWKKLGHSYIHPFGAYGEDINAFPFHQYWLKMKSCGLASSLEKYSIATMAARHNKFTRPLNINGSPLSDFGYAFQFDAGRYAQFLRSYSESRGVIRTEGKIASVDLCDSNGYIKSLTLTDGQVIDGDFFIDCTGMRGILIEGALKTGFEDWSHWLPCNSAVAVPCEKIEEPIPYTRATAHTAGWQWRIPLQHRTGNGHVFSSQYMSDDEATGILLKNLDGAVIADPRVIRFKTGRRTKFWNKNCVAIGLSSGFLEPLESTSIHLIQTAISKLINLFPSKSFMEDGAELYNKNTIFEYERIRDFLILHYKATERTDSDFWNYCRDMDVPEYLREKIKLYESTGRIYRENEELFSIPSWLAVFEGQGIIAEDYHPAIDSMPLAELTEKFKSYESVINKCINFMPDHAQYVADNCKAEKVY